MTPRDPVLPQGKKRADRIPCGMNGQSNGKDSAERKARKGHACKGAVVDGLCEVHRAAMLALDRPRRQTFYRHTFVGPVRVDPAAQDWPNPDAERLAAEVDARLIAVARR